MSEKTCIDSGPHQLIAKRKCDPVAATTVDRAFLNWNDAIRTALVVPHYEAAASARAEHERHFLPESPRRFAAGIDRYEHGRGNGNRQSFAEDRLLRSQLLRVGKILDAAPAADPEMAAYHISLWTKLQSVISVCASK